MMGSPPAPRYHHSAVVNEGSMFVFGKYSKLSSFSIKMFVIGLEFTKCAPEKQSVKTLDLHYLSRPFLQAIRPEFFIS